MKVKHPYIVSLSYSFQTLDRLFMLLDFGIGGDLNKLIKSNRMLSEDHCRLYSAQIGSAIDYLHYHNIIYRGLKPQNVVLDEKGNCKLIDFGSSKVNVHDYTYGTNSICGYYIDLSEQIECIFGSRSDSENRTWEVS